MQKRKFDDVTLQYSILPHPTISVRGHDVVSDKKYCFQMQQTLEKEIEMLKVERRELEQYVERTDMWCEFAGKWRTDICSSKVRHNIDNYQISGISLPCVTLHMLHILKNLLINPNCVKHAVDINETFCHIRQISCFATLYGPNCTLLLGW